MNNVVRTKSAEDNAANKIIAEVADGIRAIDFDRVEAEIQAHRDDKDAAERAISRARARIAEIDVELDGYKKLDVEAIADGLLGGDARVASRPEADALHDEKFSLHQGITELRRRIANSQNAIEKARNQPKIVAGELFDALAKKWEDDAKKALMLVAQIYADSYATTRIANSNSLAMLWRSLESALAESISLLQIKGPIAVSDRLAPIRDVLEENALKGATMLPSNAPIPQS